MGDEDRSQIFSSFCKENQTIISELGIRRITFLVLIKYILFVISSILQIVNPFFHRQMLPKYFTYRLIADFEEDRIYRHLEPASAFQLELRRMHHFDLTKLPTNNPTMHLYLGRAKTSAQSYRYFVRSIVRHSDLNTREASCEYFITASERVLVEAMDELDVRMARQEVSVGSNHIFLTFIAPIISDAAIIGDILRTTIDKFHQRLWRLQVMQMEFIIATRSSASSAVQMVRLDVTNNGGHCLQVELNKEVFYCKLM